MTSNLEQNSHIHRVTPLMYSSDLSKLMPAGTHIYLKLENCQPTGSFKVRGVGRLAKKLRNEDCQKLIGASGGNAGLAIAYVSQKLGVPCTIYVPETAPQMTLQRIRDTGAEVKIIGANYAETEKYAIAEGEKPGNGYVSPYNHPEIWTGHSSMIDELKEQLPSKPSAIVVSVGGGGLLLGILQGLQKVGWQNVPVVGMETYGAHCFNLSVQANAIVALEKITSVATCLGARTIVPYLLEVLPNFNVISKVVDDSLAVESCIRFADDERILVEPACGASLAAVYGGVLETLHSEGALPSLSTGPVVIIVCGGGGVSLKMLQDWATKLNVKFPS